MGSDYDCRYCSRKFPSKKGLGIHQGRVHKKERQQAESAEIQARRSAVNQNTAISLQCYPMQPVQDMPLPSWGSPIVGDPPRQGFEEVMAGRSGHDPQRRIEMPHLDHDSPNPMSYPSRPILSQPSFEAWVSKRRSDYVHSSHQQGHQQQSQGRPHEYGSQVKDDEMVADVKSDPRGMAGGDDVRLDLTEEQWKGGSVSSDSKRSHDCQYCSKKFPETRNLLALFHAESQQSQGPFAADDSSLDLELRLGPPGSVPPLHSQRSGKPSGEARVLRVEAPTDCFSSSHE